MLDKVSLNRFWNTIGRHVRVQDDGSVDGSRLPHELSQWSLDEVRGFGARCWELFATSRTWALWGAAIVIHDGAPEDTFDYFRSWLIGRGRSVFEAAIENPDSLAAIATVEALDDVVYAAAESAYRIKTSRYADWSYPAWPDLGSPVDFSDLAEMKHRYPKLCAKFW